MSTFVQSVGPYSGTYDSNDVGVIEEVWTQSDIITSEPVLAQRFGGSVIDGVYRGRNVFMAAVFKEWTAVTRSIFNPYAPTDLGSSGVIGRLNSNLAKAFVLTALDGTPAKDQGPKVRSFALAIFSPEHNMETRFGAVQRDIPIVFQILPTVSGNILTWFIDTPGDNPG